MNYILEEKIKKYGQEHLLNFINKLDATGLAVYEKQLNSLDWEKLDGLIKKYVIQKNNYTLPPNITPPSYFPAISANSELKMLYEKAVVEGKKSISSGKVAVLTVAGGQGTRLGFNGPKGTFPITPVKGKSFFQYFAEKIKRAMEKYKTDIHWLIMTSELNNQETDDYLKDRNFFGVSKDLIHFFVQGMMPSISFDGKLIMNSICSLTMSPNGHGGTLTALKDSGMLDFLSSLGINIISYFQIDNAIVSPLDPLFIGMHALNRADVSSRMLSKTGQHEKLGNFCMSEGKLYIIEYSDMPKTLAEQRESSGKLSFIAGSPAIHIFSVEFIKKIIHGKDGSGFPYHRAEKKVPFINKKGFLVNPDEPNAVKLESFIFDVLPMAEKTIILEAIREEQFSPVKNSDGIDSVQSCREMLIERDAKWLESAGIKVPRKGNGEVDCAIELSPLKYLDAEDVMMKKNELRQPERGKGNYYE
jgi:UDP-N-acetylglucosamine/UDP-N-acetylgalactosamine diphosphorylase